MSISEAASTVEDLGLVVEQERVDGRSDRGTVLDQQPAAGDRAEDGTVRLSVASGRAVVDPADLIGLEYDEAARRLVSLGLVPVRREAERPGADRTVVTALPQGRLKLGSMVTLTVGVPPSKPTSGLSPR
jgi:serine/threonine-protein kinase